MGHRHRPGRTQGVPADGCDRTASKGEQRALRPGGHLPHGLFQHESLHEPAQVQSHPRPGEPDSMGRCIQQHGAVRHPRPRRHVEIPGSRLPERLAQLQDHEQFFVHRDGHPGRLPVHLRQHAAGEEPVIPPVRLPDALPHGIHQRPRLILRQERQQDLALGMHRIQPRIRRRDGRIAGTVDELHLFLLSKQP